MKTYRIIRDDTNETTVAEAIGPVEAVRELMGYALQNIRVEQRGSTRWEYEGMVLDGVKDSTGSCAFINIRFYVELIG